MKGLFFVSLKPNLVDLWCCFRCYCCYFCLWYCSYCCYFCYWYCWCYCYFCYGIIVCCFVVFVIDSNAAVIVVRLILLFITISIIFVIDIIANILVVDVNAVIVIIIVIGIAVTFVVDVKLFFSLILLLLLLFFLLLPLLRPPSVASSSAAGCPRALQASALSSWSLNRQSFAAKTGPSSRAESSWLPHLDSAHIPAHAHERVEAKATWAAACGDLSKRKRISEEWSFWRE